MKISMKRIAALLLALVMVIGLLPIMNNTVNAVDVTGLTDASIGLAYVTAGQPNGNTSGWTASGNAITGNLQGVKRGAIYMNATSTLTITNNKSGAANLSFDYSFTTTNGGTVTVDGETVTGGSFAKKLAAGESVDVVLSAPRTTGNLDNAMSISITNLILASASNDPVTTTFEAPAFGSYTVAYGSESLTVAAGTPSQTATNLPSVSYTLTAAPGTGYKMVGWYNATADIYLGTGLTYTGSFEEACTVKAVIVPNDTAVFLAGANYFSDLNAAVAYAESNNLNQITLVQSGTLPAGSYTIPAGITLLVPMDTEYTPTRTDDEDFGVAPEFTTDYTTPYAYLTLTMADGAKLTVNGTLDVESRHTSLQGGKTTGGRPCGAYGAIYMNPNAAITVNNGANLYAWGYIYGEGTVTANSGAKVYEIMQVTDFPGGSNMSLFVDTDPTYDVDGDGNPSNDYFKTFPFSQYYVQNIEVELTLKAGAAEYVYITMTAGGQSMGLPVRFIGEGGMFVPGEGGTIVKDYDPSTDRLNVDVNGNASMAGIALDLSGTKYEGAVEDVLGTSKVDSASFILTLNGNITININSGITTVKQDLSLLPGVEINIAEEATLVVAERTYADGEYDNLTVYGTYTGYNIYVWDMDNWGNYVFKNKPLSALTYSPTTGRYVRTSADLKDVVIDINGTVICEGYIYSTVKFDDELWVPVEGAGAAVISTGKTGTLVLQNGPGPEDMAYCLDGYSDKDSAVFVDSVWLLNGDGSYVLTEGCEPGTTYGYCDVHDLWYTEGHGNCVVVNTVEITWVINGVGAPEEYLLGETPFYKGATPTKPTHVCTVYTFAGWATSPNGEVLAELPAVSGEATYFAIFTESQAHSWNAPDCENDGYCVKCGAPGEKAEGHVWRDLYSEYNGDGTHTDTFECEKCFELKEEIVECTNGKDDKAHECDVCFAELTTCKDSNQDHKCDICFERLSSCVDNSKDHYCDYAGCGAQLSSCVDSNNDHYCDYNGCRNVMSSCKDDNNDHRCDYNGCRKTLSSCVDVDDDHYCDFSGCRVQLTSCEDNDEDHFCDYLGCGEELTECEDSDENHYCDYAGCEYKMTDCVDTDGNHYCDFSGCDQKVTGCVDENLDHICDSEGCGIKVSQCADRDQNHYCDYAGCNEKRSNCVDNNQDHFCDYAGCKVKMSDCVDGNKDHRCDYSGCMDKLTNCTDGNFDHYCDYSGCKDKMSNCTDGNDDHYCDYSGCNKKLSDCVDADDNHYCDFGGCNEKLSDCDDADEDHYCDFGGCGEELTTCVDADEDHFCDYAGCGAELTSCKDNDQDHKCDYAGCGAGMSICVDSDEDHYCDFTGCREKISFCYDENQDHYCDYAKCGEKLSDCKDDNQNHKCDFTGCNAVLSSCVDANKDHQCDFESCNMKLSNCEDNDEDHRCDYAGCKDIVSACEDSNEDHYCDYAKCGKQLSDCCDDNDNHYCDYVGCGAKLSDCTPGEEDEFILLEAGCEDGEKQIIVYCALCGEVYSEEYVPIPALGHGHSEGWEYVQLDNDVHQVWCADCWGYTYDEGHSYANHVCVDCGWTEMMSIKFYNGDALWRETSTPYGGKLGIGGMPIPAAPTGYQFAGWYTENDVKVVHGMTVTENIVAYATWSKLIYTITWDVDGIVTTEPYEYGATPSFKGNTDKAADGCTTYTFTGWGKELAPVTGPVTYTAQYQTGISHTGEVKYTNNGNGTHNGAYNCCGTAYVVNETHKYTDGVCTCGAMTFSISMKDSWGDGWNANTILVYKDGQQIGTATIGYGSSATYTVEYDVNAKYELYWRTHNEYSDDCSFTVSIGGEVVMNAGGSDCNSYVAGQRIYPFCDHTDQKTYTNQGDGTHVVTCVKDGCCNNGYADIEPHVYTNGVCPCGSIAFVITMGDSWGDSWNDNAILVYKDGQQIGIATVGYGSRATFIVEYDANAKYELYWRQHNTWASECSFSVAIGGEIVMNARGSECYDYVAGQRIYPHCDHTGERTYSDNKNGTTHKVICDCKVVINHSEAHTYVNGVCACGAIETFTITWVVNGVTTTETYKYGETPSFKGNTDKAADGCTTYTFTGWDKDFAPVTGPVTYTAQYQTGISHTGEVKYTNNGNGTHNGAYDCCGTTYVTNEAHIYVDGVCACGAIEHVCADNLTFHTSVTPNCQNGGNNAYYSCSCGKFYADANASTEIAENSWILGKDSTNHTGTVGYTNNGADHTAAYSCCGESWNENHTYVNGTCVCDALKVSKLTFVYGASGEYKIELMVPYGTRLFDVVDFDVVTANMYVHSADRWGHYVQSGFYGYFDNSGNLGYLYYFGENYTMPDCDFYIEARYVYNGFIHDGIGWQYIKGEHLYKDVLMGVMMGDLYEGGSFEEFEGLYAFDENGYRIENGLFRDYYIGEWINGVTYEPNAEDIAYYESKGMTFIDAEQTWYYFGADGKWAYNYTGRFGNSYIVNGHAAWHVGLVEIEGDYYYFKGDEVNGGNIMVIGDYYISRNNTDKDVVIGGLYTFGADGKLCWYNGITEVNGVLRYYEDARLMLGNGLTQVGENFIYVNSYGNLVVDAEYYIGANSFGIAKGIYYFNANGFLVIPEEEPAKEGLFFEDGKWFYYVDGAKAYCAGLIQIDGNWVYVRSDGSLATGTYYVTNTNGHATIASGTKCTFDDNGIMIDPVLGEQVLEEGGIRDEFSVRTEVTLKANGKLTIDVFNISMVTDDQYLGFDVDIYGADGSYYNEIVRGEGVAEFDLSAGEYAVRIYIAWFDGVDDDEPGYGRGSLDYKITFTSDGTPLNGIVDGYYYVDGHIAYAAGLIEIDGYYYYVRSNGQIVTDCQYWITNVNDTGYEPGLYEFDADGWMHKIYVETFTGIKDGYYYIDDEVAYAAGLVQYNGGYIYVRSNGQVATGKYWITNHNDLLPAGFYDFGEDGFYYPAIPENAHLLMDVDKNVDTDGFWDSNAIANAVRASADGNLYIEVTDVTFEYESAGKGGFCIEFEGSYWVMQWDAVYKVGTGTVMIPVSAGEDVILFVNPADVCEDYVDSVYGTISYKVWSDVECELVQGGIGE